MSGVEKDMMLHAENLSAGNITFTERMMVMAFIPVHQHKDEYVTWPRSGERQ